MLSENKSFEIFPLKPSVVLFIQEKKSILHNTAPSILVTYYKYLNNKLVLYRPIDFNFLTFFILIDYLHSVYPKDNHS